MQSVLIKATLSIKHLFIALMAVFKNAQLLLVLADGSIHLVDARSGVTAMSFKAHNSYVCDINFSLTDGNQLVSCSGNGSIKIWDLRNAGFSSDGITPSSPSCCVSFGRSKQKAPIYGSKWCNISSSSRGIVNIFLVR